MASPDMVDSIHWQFSALDYDRNFQIHGNTLYYMLLLFGITLISILIYLFFCWLCRSSDAVTTLPTFQAPMTPPQQGLAHATINRLPITLHRISPAVNNGNVEETECCICLSVFEDGEKIKVLPWCHHRYHSECVDRWLADQSNCPLCRSSIRIESESLPV